MDGLPITNKPRDLDNKSNHWKDKTIKIKEMDETDVWLLASNN